MLGNNNLFSTIEASVGNVSTDFNSHTTDNSLNSTKIESLFYSSFKKRLTTENSSMNGLERERNESLFFVVPNRRIMPKSNDSFLRRSFINFRMQGTAKPSEKPAPTQPNPNPNPNPNPGPKPKPVVTEIQTLGDWWRACK